jgi:hypothetical protein
MSQASLALKRAQIRCKRDGTAVVINWTDGATESDPTTGRTDGGTAKTLTTKAWAHFIAPTTGAVRVHAEVEVGDCLADFLTDLVRITDAGDTTFTVGQVVDLFAFNQANRDAVDADGDPSEGDLQPLEDLGNPSFVIGGLTYVQKPFGKELAKSWEAIVSGVTMGRAVLLRRAS